MDLLAAVFRGRVRLFDEEVLNQQNSTDAFTELMEILRSTMQKLGVDVLASNYRWSWQTSVTWACITSFFIFQAYTLYAYWGDWYLLMEMFSVTGIGVQGLMKMQTAVRHYSYYRNVSEKMLLLHQVNNTNRKNNRSLVFCVILIEYAYKIVGLSYVTAGIGFFISPIFRYLLYSERTLALQIVVPGIDHATELGFWLMIVYHMVLVFVACSGILTSDMGMMLIILHVVGMADVFRNSLAELDEMLEEVESDKRKVYNKLVRICCMHKDIIGYEEDVDKFFGAIIFTQVITSVFCLSISLFLIFMTGNIQSVLFLMGALCQLLQFCILGTILTIKNEEIILALYNFLWYKLSVENQRTLCIMLHRSQNAVELTIGGLALLNMKTFVEIIKKIYTYAAMMLQFVG
ncbi:putative odorant receptor 83c [Uranotaenia lowii]|uniref:putative odorant receptor 83c n=1 Tax=Uranotaenia lowii TaxID=190385 RepID=UPI00247AF68C|nr:putative odorant receptor 83c [Uranotaenia lowii]